MGWQHKTPEERREAGLKGGLKTKQKLLDNPDYYAELGLKGSKVRIAKAGGLAKFRKIASQMGKMSGKTRGGEEA